MTSVSEIERDIEATRNRLYGTIDRIQDKLTVAGIVDEVMGAAGVPRSDAGHDFVLGLIRRNPVPVLIAAAGIGFMIYRMNRRAARQDEMLREDIADVEYVEVPAIDDARARSYPPVRPLGSSPALGPTGTATGRPVDGSPLT